MRCGVPRRNCFQFVCFAVLLARRRVRHPALTYTHIRIRMLTHTYAYVMCIYICTVTHTHTNTHTHIQHIHTYTYTHLLARRRVHHPALSQRRSGSGLSVGCRPCMLGQHRGGVWRTALSTLCSLNLCSPKIPCAEGAPACVMFGWAADATMKALDAAIECSRYLSRDL